MFKNYCRIACRNLLRTRRFSLINITGLVMGISCAIFICLWMYNEVSFDQFHQHKDRIYQVYNRANFDNKLQCWNWTPPPMAPALQQDCAGIAATCRMRMASFVLDAGGKKFTSNGYFTDHAFYSMFSFPFEKGSTGDVRSVILTAKTAAKLFGNTDPIDKVITIDGDHLKVAGVLKDLPLNSSIDFEFLLPYEYLKVKGWDNMYWGNNSLMTYVQLSPHTTEEVMNSRIRDITQKHKSDEPFLAGVEVFLHPMNKWHLYSNFENGKISGGRIETVRLFGIIAGLILLIACINFMNLSTARSEKRAKEVGIRKAVGALRQSLIVQFLVESFILVLIAGVIAILLVTLTLPAFNRLINQQLLLPYQQPVFWLALLGFIVITGFIAGSYPAFFLSSFNPVGIFKGTFSKPGKTINHRKILVVLQFSIAITMIISTIIIVRQLQHARNRNAGFTGELLMYHKLNRELFEHYQPLKDELLSSGLVTSMTRTGAQMTEHYSTAYVSWKGKSPGDNTMFEIGTHDDGLVQTAGLKLLMGRDLDLEKYRSDSSAALINESAMKAMGMTHPLGEIFRDNNDRDRVIVGVVADYIVTSPYEHISPMVIVGIKGSEVNYLHARLAAQPDVIKQLKEIEQIFNKYSPSYPFEYHFTNQDYEKKFEDIRRVARLTTLFAILTILISCLGLFGLASYMAELRMKEIGIRKVMGASVSRIIRLLTKDFLLLVSIALLIAIPIAWYAMHQWLRGYAYRTTMDWWIFAATGILVIMISVLTTGYHAVKAALINPVKSLRSE